MKKVILSKQESVALESALDMMGGVRANVSNYHSVDGLWEGNREALNGLDLETVNCALYVGYEVEASPEEKIKEYYDHHLNLANHVYNKGFVSGINNTLHLLNIQIKGINC